MKVNLRKIANIENGFILKTNGGYYGHNYEFDPVAEVEDGDLFLFSDLKRKKYVLMKFNGGKLETVMKENFGDTKIFTYLCSLR